MSIFVHVLALVFVGLTHGFLNIPREMLLGRATLVALILLILSSIQALNIQSRIEGWVNARHETDKFLLQEDSVEVVGS